MYQRFGGTNIITTNIITSLQPTSLKHHYNKHHYVRKKRLMTEAAIFSETTVKTYQTTRRHIPEGSKVSSLNRQAWLHRIAFRIN
jgi:hypothetical protein